MLKKIIFAFLGLFLWACDVRIWEIKEPSTEEKNEATPQIAIKKNGKVAKALDFLNELFGEPNLRFEKSNIEKIYEFPDKEKRNCLQLVSFKKKRLRLD